MKEILYSSVTGNAAKLANVIKDFYNEDIYCGKIKEVTADTVFVGFWTTKNSCSKDIEDLLVSLNNKKIFLFGTCGYNNTEEFFNNVLNNVKSNINNTNEVIGSFICQGKVSDAKRENLKQTNPNYDNMASLLEESVNHPNEDDLNKLINTLKEIRL